MKKYFSLLFILFLCLISIGCGKNAYSDSKVLKLLSIKYNKVFEVVSADEMNDGHPFPNKFYRGIAREVNSDKTFTFTLSSSNVLYDNYYSTYSDIAYPDYDVRYNETMLVYNSAEDYLSDYNVYVDIKLTTDKEHITDAYNKVSEVASNPYCVFATIKVGDDDLVLRSNKDHELTSLDDVLKSIEQ